MNRIGKTLYMKTVLSVLLCMTLLIGLLPVFSLPAKAANAGFIDNAHWISVSSQTLTRKHNSGESFVCMFYRNGCFNSNLRKVIVEDWMNSYDLDIYAVDIDQYSIPEWVWEACDSSAVILPVICMDTAGKTAVFTAEDNMRLIQKSLQEFLGVFDASEVSFSLINSEIFDTYSMDADTLRKLYCLPENEIYEPIVTLTKELTEGLDTETGKLKAIYDWVTGNIYYNYGMADGTIARRDSALEVYLYRDTICTGFANLTQAMCSAAGIPCRVINGFAAGVDTESTIAEVWKTYRDYLTNSGIDAYWSAIETYTNHSWNEAFADGRWVILDTTWGCNLEFYPDVGGIIEAAPTDAYFDPELEDISESHLFWTDGSMREALQPSAWARDEIDAAVSAGLVPEKLRKHYTKPISRADAALMIVKLLEKCSGMSIDQILKSKNATINRNAFTDTADEAIFACNALDILKGVGNGLFDPSGNFTRAQIAAIMNRVAKVCGIDTDGYTHDFTDTVGHWCDSELGWPTQAGLIKGVGDRKFAPDAPLTTEQAIALMYRAMKAM